MNHLRRGLLSFVLLFAGCGDDECPRYPIAYAFDEPGPWDETPADVFGHLEESRSETLTWVGPLLEEELDPSLAETEVTLELTLDKSSVTGVPNGLTCNGELQIDATLTIVTADGNLDESFPVVLMTAAGSNSVSAEVDLTGYDFAGTLELTPGWTKHEMLLGLIWGRDAGLTGVMRTGAVLDAQAIGDPNTKSGFYATIFANG